MAASSVIGLLRVLLSANTAEFDSAMKQSANAAQAWSKSLKSVGQQATQAGAALTKSLTLPILGIAGASTKAAIDFESSFAGVRKTVNATEAEFGQMSQALRGLAKTIPVNVNELNRLAEAAGAMGIPKKEIVDFTRVMALLGVTTNVTSEQAAESIGKIQNIFGAAGKDTEKFADTLVALGNDGASTESQILEMATRIAGAGNTIGMTQGQVLAFASALSSVGIEAEMGGSAISRVFIDIAASVSQGGQKLEEFARVAGKPVQEFARLFKEDAATAVNAFIGGLGRIKDAGGDLLGTLRELDLNEIRVRDTLLRTAGAGDLLTKALDLQNKSWTEGGALQREAAERFKTTEAQITLLWNRIKDVGITIGNALLPAIKSTTAAIGALLPIVDTLAKGFAMMPGPIQAVAVGMVAAAAAAGPLIYAFGQLALSGQALTRLFTKDGLGTKLLAGQFGNLRGAAVDTIAWLTKIGAAARASGILMAGFSAALVGIVVPAALIIIGDRIRQIQEDADKLEKASALVGRFVSNLREAEEIIKAQEAGLAGLIPKDTKSVDAAKQWREAKGPAQEYAGEVIKITTATEQATMASRSFIGMTIEQAQALQQMAGTAQRYAGGVISIGMATEQAKKPTDLLAAAEARLARSTFDYEMALKGKAAAVRFDIENMEKTGDTLEVIADRYKVGVDVVKRFKGEIDSEDKAHNKAEKAATKHAEAIKKLNAELSGLDAIEEAEKTFKALPPLYKLNEDGLRQVQQVLGEGLAAHARMGTVAPEAWKKTYVEVLQATIAYDKAALAVDAATELTEIYGRTAVESLGQATDAAQDYHAAVAQLSREEVDEILRTEEDSLEKRLFIIHREMEEKRRAVTGNTEQRREQLDIINRLEARAAADATAQWRQHMADVRRTVNSYGNIFKEALAQIPNLIAATIVGGKEAFASLGKSIASGLGAALGGKLFGDLAAKLSNTLFKAFGTNITAALGKVIPVIGEALGSLIGPLLSKVFKTESKQINNIRDEFLKDFGRAGTGVGSGFLNLAEQLRSVTDGQKLFNQLMKANSAKEWEAAVKAVNAALQEQRDALTKVGQAGGIASKELIKFRDATKDTAATLDFIKSQTSTAASSFGAFAQIGADAYKKLDELREKFKNASGAERDQLAREIQAQEALIKAVGVTTQEAAAGIGAAFAGTFAALQEQGLSVRQALEQMAPGIAAFKEQLEKAGLSGGAAFDYIARLAEIAAGQISGPALDAIHQLSTGLAAAHNAGFLTQEMFSGIVGQILKARDALVAEGATSEEVLALMRGDLQKVWQLQQDFGFVVDDATQELINQGIEAGKIGDKFRDPIDRAARAMERVVELLEQMTGQADKFKKKLGEVPSEIVVKGRVDFPPDPFGDVSRSANEAEEDVNAVSYGRSPGGIEQIPIELDKAATAAASFARQFGAHFLVAEGAVNDAAKGVTSLGDNLETVGSGLEGSEAFGAWAEGASAAAGVVTDALKAPATAAEMLARQVMREEAWRDFQHHAATATEGASAAIAGIISTADALAVRLVDEQAFRAWAEKAGMSAEAIEQAIAGVEGGLHLADLKARDPDGWALYRKFAESAADAARRKIETVSGALEDVSADLQEVPRDLVVTARVDVPRDPFEDLSRSAQDAEADVNALLYGRSPGGLVEIPVKLSDAERAAADFARVFGTQVGGVQGAIDGVTGKLSDIRPKLGDATTAAGVFADRFGGHITGVQGAIGGATTKVEELGQALTRLGLPPEFVRAIQSAVQEIARMAGVAEGIILNALAAVGLLRLELQGLSTDAITAGREIAGTGAVMVTAFDTATGRAEVLRVKLGDVAAAVTTVGTTATNTAPIITEALDTATDDAEALREKLAEVKGAVDDVGTALENPPWGTWATEATDAIDDIIAAVDDLIAKLDTVELPSIPTGSTTPTPKPPTPGPPPIVIGPGTPSPTPPYFPPRIPVPSPQTPRIPVPGGEWWRDIQTFQMAGAGIQAAALTPLPGPIGQTGQAQQERSTTNSFAVTIDMNGVEIRDKEDAAQIGIYLADELRRNPRVREALGDQVVNIVREKL